MTDERGKFMSALADQRRNGMVALRLTFCASRSVTPEEIFAALNEVEEAVKTGLGHRGWDGDMPASRLQ